MDHAFVSVHHRKAFLFLWRLDFLPSSRPPPQMIDNGVNRIIQLKQRHVGLERERQPVQICFKLPPDPGRIKRILGQPVEGVDLRPLKADHVQNEELARAMVMGVHKIQQFHAEVSERIGTRRVFDDIAFHPEEKLFFSENGFEPRKIFLKRYEAPSPVVSNVNVQPGPRRKPRIRHQIMDRIRPDRPLPVFRCPDGLGHPCLKFSEVFKPADLMGRVIWGRRIFQAHNIFSPPGPRRKLPQRAGCGRRVRA